MAPVKSLSTEASLSRRWPWYSPLFPAGPGTGRSAATHSWILTIPPGAILTQVFAHGHGAFFKGRFAVLSVGQVAGHHIVVGVLLVGFAGKIDDAVHIQRLENMLTHIVGKGLPGQLLDNKAEAGVHIVVVVKGFAGGVDNKVGGIGQVGEKVFPQAGGVDAAVVLKSISKAEHTGIQRGDAGAVGQQVVQLDGWPGGKWFYRQVLGNAVVGEFALFFQLQQGEGGKRFGDAANAEQGIGGHGVLGF